MDFITKLPKTKDGHDTIWVIVDRLTKSAHFLPIKETCEMEKFTRTYIRVMVLLHGVPHNHRILQSSHDPRSERPDPKHSTIAYQSPAETPWGTSCLWSHQFSKSIPKTWNLQIGLHRNTIGIDNFGSRTPICEIGGKLISSGEKSSTLNFFVQVVDSMLDF